MSLNGAMSEAERETRIKLAALYRLCAHAGMTDLIYTHITARVPGEDEHFLINRFGVLFEHMRASDLVKIDHTGEIVEPYAEGEKPRVNVAGFNIHSAVHMGRPDLHWVIHTHTSAGMGVSAQRDGLLPLTQHAMMFHESIGYHDYESFASRLEERDRIRADLGNHKVMILRNHGMLVAGESVGEAYFLAHHLERACQAQIMAQSGGAVLNMPDPQVAVATRDRIAQMPPAAMDFFWDSCLAMVEAERPDYSQ